MLALPKPALSKIKAGLGSASVTFVLYDLKNKKYLYNTMRNIKITDKSEFYQTLYNNYSAARKTIKQ